jgi:hypothetical protein
MSVIIAPKTTNALNRKKGPIVSRDYMGNIGNNLHHNKDHGRPKLAYEGATQGAPFFL